MLLCMLFSGTTVSATQKAEVVISSAEELKAFATAVNAGNDHANISVLLEADITLNEKFMDNDGNLLKDNMEEWTPIGTEENPFRGTFNGNGHVISGLYINTDKMFQGFFGVADGAYIYNVYVVDGYISAKAHAGGIIGYAKKNTVISSCHNVGTDVYTGDRSGGIAGWTNHADIYNCTNTGYCYSGRCAGGIVGDIYSGGKLYNCENSGKIDGKSLIGGIAGGTTSADIQNCLNVGEVVSGYLIAGGAGSRKITNCFAYKNEQFNQKIGGTAYVFADEKAVLSEAVTVGETSCADVVTALNTYGASMETPVPMTIWFQYASFPYLNRENLKTDFGSTVSGWSKEEVEEAYTYDLIPDVLIGEDLTEPVTRAEFAAIAVQLYESWKGEEANADAGNPFGDIAGERNKTEILKAYALGITDGTSATTFEPGVLITREQLATMLCRTYKKKEWANWTLSSDNDFTLNYSGVQKFADDGDISEYAKPSVYFMVKYGIIKGIGDNKFAPKSTSTAQNALEYATATREQAVLMALRSFENLK